MITTVHIFIGWLHFVMQEKEIIDLFLQPDDCKVSSLPLRWMPTAQCQ